MTADVVVRTHAAMRSAIGKHEWASHAMQEQVTRDLLALVSEVPYRGDDSAYVLEAWDLACAVMNPIVEQQRGVAALRRMKTSGTIH